MSKQFYQEVKFKPDTLALIDTVNNIVDEYVAQSYRLTVRQLYYQLVARGHIENTERSYKRITGIVNDGKLAGLIDWDAIEDRTREFLRRSRWGSGAEILESAAESFHMDMWEGQKHRVFVIVEKEALAGVLDRACRALDVPLLAARGYPSGTVLREHAIADLIPAVRRDQEIVLLHLGDHDPSGIDMTRDLAERLAMFVTGRPIGALPNLRRIALNMDQIESQQPPPNPAKTTDSRFASYVQQFGDESWELDALRPEFLDSLVRRHIETFINRKTWKARMEEIAEVKSRIRQVAKDFEE